MNEQRFQVDLRGVVDLLSHHLYASPRVYVRELLQNATDAITARRALEPDAPALVRFEPGDRVLRVHDTGIGLTEAQVHELLATIGRSSKRDELGFARHEFLGQFGIGLLSCFLVADEIHVSTRAAGSSTVEWTGYSDGRYRVQLAEQERADVGTTVTLLPRRGAEEWLTTATVTELARFYGSLLPVTVEVGGTATTEKTPPWEAADREWALREYAREVLRIEPLAVIDLAVPEAGLTGVAFVLSAPASPTARAGHRVYLKRMLLAENAEGLLPDWAFYARCVVDATELRPTASREALYEDSLLEATRRSLGDQLRGWLVRLAAQDPRRLAEFLEIHHLGVKAMAVHDSEMLRLIERFWPMETNVGPMTLADFRDRYGVLRYTPTVDQFRQLATVAAAQQVALINGGYIYDSQLIERIPVLDRAAVVQRLDPAELATRFAAVDETQVRPFLAAAQQALDPLGCEVVLRSFAPTDLAAIYLLDAAAAFREQWQETRETAGALWSGVLDALDHGGSPARPRLVLNHRNALVRRVTGLSDPGLLRLAVEALYGQALLLGYHPLRPADTALLNQSFLGLLERAVSS
jgi:molecular chaperone HtpG